MLFDLIQYNSISYLDLCWMYYFKIFLRCKYEWVMNDTWFLSVQGRIILYLFVAHCESKLVNKWSQDIGDLYSCISVLGFENVSCNIKAFVADCFIAL